jgi:hypothetical protein
LRIDKFIFILFYSPQNEFFEQFLFNKQNPSFFVPDDDVSNMISLAEISKRKNLKYNVISPNSQDRGSIFNPHRDDPIVKLSEETEGKVYFLSKPY